MRCAWDLHQRNSTGWKLSFARGALQSAGKSVEIQDAFGDGGGG
jgi:hypothetical protein